MTAAALAALLLVYWPAPQADAVHHFMWRAAGLDRNAAGWRDSVLDPCAASRFGEGLADVTGTLRGELRRFADTADAARGAVPAPIAGSCVPPQVQVAFLAAAFPRHYPACAARFAAGDLDALQRCWGEGRSK